MSLNRSRHHLRIRKAEERRKRSVFWKLGEGSVSASNYQIMLSMLNGEAAISSADARAVSARVNKAPLRKRAPEHRNQSTSQKPRLLRAISPWEIGKSKLRPDIEEACHHNAWRIALHAIFRSRGIIALKSLASGDRLLCERAFASNTTANGM